jgi:hypothetical protein
MLTPEEVAKLADGTLDVMSTMEVALRSKAAQALADLDTGQRTAVEFALREVTAESVKPVQTAVAEAFTTAATTGVARDEVIYEAARIAGLVSDFAPLADSLIMSRVLTDGIATAQNAMNLVMTSAREAVMREYLDALDTAMLQVVSGAAAPDVAIAGAVKRLADLTPSVTFVNQAGEVVQTTLYSAVRRNVITGAHQATLRIQEARMREVGARYVEISAHAGARPEHAEWQGTVIPYDELEAVTGYGEVDGLGGANCGHSWSPFFPGIMEPTDNSYLDSRDNEEDYELSQRQRQCERNIRTYQARADVYSAGGQTAEAKRNEALAGKWRAEERSVAKQRSGAVRLDRSRPYPGEAKL